NTWFTDLEGEAALERYLTGLLTDAPNGCGVHSRVHVPRTRHYASRHYGRQSPYDYRDGHAGATVHVLALPKEDPRKRRICSDPMCPAPWKSWYRRSFP